MADINLGVGGANSATGGFNIDNSLKLEEDNTEYLYYTPSSQTDYERMTFSIWIKRTELTGSGNPTRLAEFGNGTANTTNLRIGFDTSDRLFIYGNSIVWRETTQVFRDTNAWYHLFFKFDTTQGTSNDRVRVWVNGQMIAHTDYNTVNNPGSGTAMGFNRTNRQTIGQQQEGGVTANNGFNGYIAQAWGSGGTPPDVTDFGEYDDDSGIWKPKDISELSIPDSNGFFLDFSDSSDLGNDSSSNNNDFTLNNISAADQATDTPTNNFTTFNCVRRFNSDNLTVTDGGTVLLKNATSTWTTGFNTIAVNKGKWYWEGELYANEGYQMFGQTPQHNTERNVNIDWYLGKTSDKQSGAGYYGSGEDVYYEGGYAHSSASTAGDIISVAMDCDNNKVHFAVNGVYTNSSDPVNNTNGFAMLDEYQYFAMATFLANTSYRANFGGYTTISISSAASDANGYGTFEYAPPSGYYALCTKNLAEYG